MMPVTNLKKAVSLFLRNSSGLDAACRVLDFACRSDVSRFESFADIAGEEVNDILLELWEWKFILPRRSSKCGEWDSRILLPEPGALYEMPNISRTLVLSALKTGRWDSPKAVIALFRLMGEPDWRKLPALVLEIRNGCIHNTITGARIGAACVHNGLKDKTGAMIAVLKGAGIISPKLMAIGRLLKATSPVYEFNPCVWAER